jgi:chemotaxis protein methyltransferase CheR
LNNKNQSDVEFLRWALPKLGYRWKGFRKPRSQVLQRIRERVAELNLSGFSDYKSFLETHTEEWKILDKLLFVTISRFFRDRKLWDDLTGKIIPELAERNNPEKIRAWSAGCCNGEEPYSIAIAADLCGYTGNTSILASDRNPYLLERAKTGIYPSSSIKELTKHEKEYFFEKIDDEPNYRIVKSIKNGVKFEQRDIKKSLPDETFDLIFCRYLVFTYFDISSQKSFLESIKNILNDGGYLIIGSNETLPETDWLETTTVHQDVFRNVS